MSRAFSGLGFVAAVVLVLIILGHAVTGGASCVAGFFERYYIAIGIVLLLAAASGAIVIYRSSDAETLSAGLRTVNSIVCGLALVQNLAFLAYGLYRAVKVYQNDAFLTLLSVGGFVLVYLINLFLTVGAIVLSCSKKWGICVACAQIIAGIVLIINW